MGLDQNGAEDKDERLPYLPGLGQGEKLADDEELVADMSCTKCPDSTPSCVFFLISM
jgi:hypothetical protein